MSRRRQKESRRLLNLGECPRYPRQTGGGRKSRSLRQRGAPEENRISLLVVRCAANPRDLPVPGRKQPTLQVPVQSTQKPLLFDPIHGPPRLSSPGSDTPTASQRVCSGSFRPAPNAGAVGLREFPRDLTSTRVGPAGRSLESKQDENDHGYDLYPNRKCAFSCRNVCRSSLGSRRP